jgi:5-methylcytosine-specific restriction endonuclease McrA
MINQQAIWPSAEWLFVHYVSNGENSRQIAEIVGVNKSSVPPRLRGHGIHVRSLSESKMGIPRDTATRGKMRTALCTWLGENRGQKRSMETRRKISLSKQGDKNPAWRGGVVGVLDKIRNSTRMEEWRRAVKFRDGYICQVCFKGDEGDLVAHHINQLALDSLGAYVVDNGKTLCVKCHKEAHRVKSHVQQGKEPIYQFVSKLADAK